MSRHIGLFLPFYTHSDDENFRTRFPAALRFENFMPVETGLDPFQKFFEIRPLENFANK
jgi:hypothetical protein